MMARPVRLPPISKIAFTRGWYFILAWCHRISGVLLVLFVWLYIVLLPSRMAADASEGGLPAFKSILLSSLLWLMAIPVIFHALNGGRLMLYESFGRRDDEAMVRWVLGLSALYLGLLGLTMLLGTQSVSPFLYWLILCMIGVVLAYAMVSRIGKTRHAYLWKLQRTTAAFLLPTVPGYILMISLRPPMGSHVDMVRTAIQSAVLKPAFLLILLCAVFHGAYGLVSIVNDYVASKIIRAVGAALIIVAAVLVVIVGVTGIVGA
jgi:succinate dehydrogenase hydrophobic membrane anchor protein